MSFYFDDQLRVALDDEAARQEMFEAVSPAREIVLGYPMALLMWLISVPVTTRIARGPRR